MCGTALLQEFRTVLIITIRRTEDTLKENKRKAVPSCLWQGDGQDGVCWVMGRGAGQDSTTGNGFWPKDFFKILLLEKYPHKVY